MNDMKDMINNWIENTLADRVDYFGDFMESLEKHYPELHQKFLDLIWEYGAEEMQGEDYET